MKRYVCTSENMLQKYKFIFQLSQVWYENGKEVDRDTWQETANATASDSLIARMKIENRLEKKYGSKTGEWDLEISVVEGPKDVDKSLMYKHGQYL